LRVFAGFLLAKGEGYQTKRGDKYRVLALCSLFPFLGDLDKYGRNRGSGPDKLSKEEYKALIDEVAETVTCK
jgi:hypothetical protein